MFRVKLSSMHENSSQHGNFYFHQRNLLSSAEAAESGQDRHLYQQAKCSAKHQSTSSNMITKSIPTVAVVGALGTQGASVITALINAPSTSNWQIRALTSSPDSSAAQRLASDPNITIVQCDIEDTASIRAAFKGCSHIFINTMFNGPTLLSEGPEAAEELENSQGLNLVRAAAATETLEHLVFSTLSDAKVISEGKWHIPHFQSKQGANAFILGGYPGDGLDDSGKEEGWGSLRDKTTLLCVTMYASNLIWDPYRPRKRVSTCILR
jgi:nucleoside-diphosphate-sugar epimerase